jgi:hypothetical protein
MPGFINCVQETWNKEAPANQNPLGVLHIKLSRTVKALKKWSKSLVPQGKLTMAICREVIDRFETAQEQRTLSPQEHSLLQLLKFRILGLAAIEKNRARQRSRLTCLRHGDANSNFFHLMANSRKKKKFIHTLQTENGVAVSHHIGTYVPRGCTLNFHALGWQPRPLHHLEASVTEEELHEVIRSAPKEKAPRSDGFIGLFFSQCWSIIKADLLQVVHHFLLLNQQGLHMLNQANIVLIPKKALTTDNMAKKIWPCNPLCSLCYCDQNQFIISLRAATTLRLSGMPLRPTSTSRIMPLWAPIKVCCSGSQSSIGQVA